MILPVHQNDLKAAKPETNSSAANSATPTITSEDLQTISTEIHKLEKEDSFESKNVKTVSPASKPKSFNGKQQQQRDRRAKHQLKSFIANDQYAKAKDYGNFDFCVVEKKKKTTNLEEERRSITPDRAMVEEEAFPRRRRPVNGFISARHEERIVHRRERDSSKEKKETARHSTNQSGFSAGNLCLCSALIALALIASAVFVMLHPAIQIYLRLHTSYIHVLNPPV